MKTQPSKLVTRAAIPLILFMLLTPLIGFNQNIAKANLSWEADQMTDTQTQMVIAYKATFKTIGSQSIEWIQKRGQLNTTYTVTGTEGKWTDITSNGSFTYLLTRNGNACRMTIEKTDSGMFITMDFGKIGENIAVQRFRIQSVQATTN